MNTSLIAPCGMNCGICLGHLRDKNVCQGCWGDIAQKLHHCANCSIKNCELLANTDSKFCYECPKFPCTRLKQLDKRYRTKYHMSMIQNLETIRGEGLNKFLQQEHKRWLCPVCGGVICVHSDYCLNCKGKIPWI